MNSAETAQRILDFYLPTFYKEYYKDPYYLDIKNPNKSYFQKFYNTIGEAKPEYKYEEGDQPPIMTEEQKDGIRNAVISHNMCDFVEETGASDLRRITVAIFQIYNNEKNEYAIRHLIEYLKTLDNPQLPPDVQKIIIDYVYPNNNGGKRKTKKSKKSRKSRKSKKSKKSRK